MWIAAIDVVDGRVLRATGVHYPMAGIERQPADPARAPSIADASTTAAGGTRRPRRTPAVTHRDGPAGLNALNLKLIKRRPPGCVTPTRLRWRSGA